MGVQAREPARHGTARPGTARHGVELLRGRTAGLCFWQEQTVHQLFGSSLSLLAKFNMLTNDGRRRTTIYHSREIKKRESASCEGWRSQRGVNVQFVFRNESKFIQSEKVLLSPPNAARTRYDRFSKIIKLDPWIHSSLLTWSLDI